MSYRFEVLLLGTNSALPSVDRFPSAQILFFHNYQMLIDCGEGTQLRIAQSKAKANKINKIFISHLHGDHLYGLPGLLGSFHHLNRSQPLAVYGPPGIRDFLDTSFRISHTHISYPLDILEIDPIRASTIALDTEVSVTFFPLQHRIPTLGFHFYFQPANQNIRPEKIQEYNLSVSQIKNIIAGDDLKLAGGKLIPHAELSFQKHKAKAYAYCSDTIYHEKIIPFIDGVDLLYHETTYMDGLEEEAKKYQHSTLGQAIKIAKKGRVKKLLTGHYSNRYHDLSAFAEAAKNSSFPILIGRDLESYQF